jgi:hypothetical protein
MSDVSRKSKHKNEPLPPSVNLEHRNLDEVFASMSKTNRRQKRPVSGKEICAMIREDRDSR